MGVIPAQGRFQPPSLCFRFTLAGPFSQEKGAEHHGRGCLEGENSAQRLDVPLGQAAGAAAKARWTLRLASPLSQAPGVRLILAQLQTPKGHPRPLYAPLSGLVLCSKDRLHKERQRAKPWAEGGAPVPQMSPPNTGLAEESQDSHQHLGSDLQRSSQVKI